MLFIHTIHAQTTTSLPLKEWNSSSQTPFVFYISGDGGFNKFSTELCGKLNTSGYQITALNAKSYFWDKKTPAETASAISAYLAKQFSGRKNQQLVLAGYSFGADVMPFIVNKLPDSLRNKLVSVLLLSPATTTDFEVHWSDMFGGTQKRSMDVIAEINKMSSPKTVTIFGNDETDFPVNDIRLKNHIQETLPGGHHFDGDTDEVAKRIMKYFK